MDNIKTILDKRKPQGIDRPGLESSPTTLNENYRLVASERSKGKFVRLPNECICPSIPGTGHIGYTYASHYADGTQIGQQDFLYGESFMCSCKVAESEGHRREWLIQHANVPPAPAEYGAWRFDDFKTVTKEQNAAKVAAIQWCSGSGDDYKPLLMLYGPVGTGKTHLACAAAHSLLGENIQVRYEYVPLLLDYLRRGYDDNSYHARADEVRQATVLILDDFNAARVTDWAHEELLKIIHYRHEENSSLMVTTNVLPADFEPRIANRLTDHYRSRVIPMMWDSWRTK